MTTTTKTPDTYREFTVAKPEVSCGDPVGALEMAERLDIQDRSIHMIRRRGQLPAPDYEMVNGSRAWEWSTILWWAGETSRLRTPELQAAYRDMFGVSPPDLDRTRVAPGVTQRVDDDPTTPTIPSMPVEELDVDAVRGKDMW